jgi:glycosyltransferase 2 family protein
MTTASGNEQESAGGAAEAFHPWRLSAGGLAFAMLTAGIFWYQFRCIGAGDDVPRWAGLQWRYLALILLCLPVETLVSGLRIWVLSRTLHPALRLWPCIEAELANVAMNLLTPAHSGGGPGQIYMLSRHGVHAGTALTLSLLGFLGTMVGLLGMGLYSVLVSGLGRANALFAGSVGVLGIMAVAMVLAGIEPGLFRIVLGRVSRVVARLRAREDHLHDWWPPDSDRSGPPVDRLGRITGTFADIIHTYRSDVRRFLRDGKASFGWVCLLSFAFLFSRCLLPYLCLEFLGVRSGTLGQVIEAQMALVFLVFFAPTPGGAGLAEAASLSLMAGIVPVGFAPYYNLLWRFSTAYLAATAGAVCLLHAFAQDARRLFHHRP